MTNNAKKLHEMTNNQKKLVFEYMLSYFRKKYELNIGKSNDEDAIKWLLMEKCYPPILWDGNDMVEGINKMKENEDSKKFRRYTYAKFCKEMTAIEFLKINYEDWLFGNPENFFSLMGEWLEVKK